MTGAHCLRCRELGPAITLDLPDDVPSIGLCADIEFECERCGARWSWTATREANGWIYVPNADREES